MFRFFHFPRVVLDEVIRCMNPLDLITVSQCSKHSLTLLQYLVSHKPYALEMRSDESISIFYEDSKYTVFACDENYRSYDHVATPKHPRSTLDELEFVVFESKKDEVSTLWDDRFDGLYSLYHHFIAIYQKPIRFLNFKDYGGFQNNYDILLLVSRNQTRIEKANVSVAALNVEEANDLLATLQSVEHLTLYLDVCEEIANRKYEFKSIRVACGLWVTLPRLLNMNCDKVSIDWVGYTSTDLNLYLKCWILNFVPRAKEVSLELDVELSVALTDIPHEETKNRSKLDAQFTTIVGTAYDIRRCDGVIATVFVMETGDTFGHHRVSFELRVIDQ